MLRIFGCFVPAGEHWLAASRRTKKAVMSSGAILCLVVLRAFCTDCKCSVGPPEQSNRMHVLGGTNRAGLYWAKRNQNMGDTRERCSFSCVLVGARCFYSCANVALYNVLLGGQKDEALAGLGLGSQSVRFRDVKFPRVLVRYVHCVLCLCLSSVSGYCVLFGTDWSGIFSTLALNAAIGL